MYDQEMIEPDYLSQLSPEERIEVNKALGFALLWTTGIITYNRNGDHRFGCDEEVAKWVKRIS